MKQLNAEIGSEYTDLREECRKKFSVLTIMNSPVYSTGFEKQIEPIVSPSRLLASNQTLTKPASPLTPNFLQSNPTLQSLKTVTESVIKPPEVKQESTRGVQATVKDMKFLSHERKTQKKRRSRSRDIATVTRATNRPS